MVKGPEFSRLRVDVPGWEWQVTAYLNLALLSLEVQDGLYYQGWWTALDLRSGSPDVSLIAGTLYHTTDLGYDYIAPPVFPDTTGWVTGWYKFGVRLNLDNTLEFQVKPEADDDDWLAASADHIWNPGVTPVLAPNLWTRRVYPENAASVLNLWKYEWRRLT